MFSSPAIVISLVLIVILSIIQIVMLLYNRFLFLPFIINLIILLIVFITQTFVQSTIIIPFVNLLIGFSVGTLVIMLYVAGKSVKVMQQKFVALIDFQLINFVFAWVFLIFSIIYTNAK